MSKRLGDNYLTDNIKRWHKRVEEKETRYYVPGLDGAKFPLPRYYKEKIYTALERQVIGVKLKNLEIQENDPMIVINKIRRNEQRLNRETNNQKKL